RQLLTLCYNDLASTQSSRAVRKWWNWQTHHLEGVAPRGMGVQVPPSAPNIRADFALRFLKKTEHAFLSDSDSPRNRLYFPYHRRTAPTGQKRRSCRRIRRSGLADGLWSARRS